MATTFAELFDPVVLSGVVANATKAMQPNSFLDLLANPAAGSDILDDSSPTDTAEVEIAHPIRTPQRTTPYGGASRAARTQIDGTKQVKMLHSFEHLDITGGQLQLLRALAETQNTQSLQQRLARRMKNIVDMQMETRRQYVASMLCLGYIYRDSKGNMLGSSSGADTTKTIDYGVPSGNKTTVGGTLTANWSSATADIIGDIQKMKAKAVAATGHPLKYAIFGKNIKGYLAANNGTKNLINGSPSASEAMIGEAVASFEGLTWVSGIDWQLISATDEGVESATSYLSANQIVFLPEITADWYRFHVGGYSIPQSGIYSTDLESAVAGMRDVRGMFSYAKELDDPAGVRMFYGDTCLPWMPVPNAIYITTVPTT